MGIGERIAVGSGQHAVIDESVLESVVPEEAFVGTAEPTLSTFRHELVHSIARPRREDVTDQCQVLHQPEAFRR